MTTTSEETDSSITQKPQFININVHKAGLDGLDQERINEIIQETSKGSNFYSFQQKRQKRIDSQINQFKSKVKAISEEERQHATKKADILIAELEQHRVLNKIIVHFDMDMFYAAVEIKKNPNLADVPMAVGSMAMISTSNYIARRFGVRSAMAGFIAKKLCPQLILIKPNFKNYVKESEFVMNIIREYDPNLKSFSLDEVYIDLTDYVFTQYSFENNVTIEELNNLTKLSDDIWQYAYKIVNDIRTRVHEETKLTVSAGISCNTLLAKVCTDINKPNGQFLIKGNRQEIMDFVSKTELRKFSGIGPVRGKILAAFNILKGYDIFKERSLLLNLFSELNVISYLKIYLGIGSSYLNEDETAQKSHSRERTVGEMSDFNDICHLIQDISARLSKDLKCESQMCRTITLKLKKTTFEVFIKSRTIDKFTDDEEVIFNVGKELLSQEISKSPQNKYRLIGLRVSNLRNHDTSCDDSSNQSTLSQFLKLNPKVKKPEQNANSPESMILNYECVLCDQTFYDASNYEIHKYYCEGDFDENSLSNEHNKEEKEVPLKIYNKDLHCSDEPSDLPTKKDVSEKNEKSHSKKEEEPQFLKCPICQLNTLFNNNDDLNHHIDICLNRELCIELTTVPDRIARSNSDLSLKKMKYTSFGIKRDCHSSAVEKDFKKINKKRCSRMSPQSSNQKRIDNYFRLNPE